MIRLNYALQLHYDVLQPNAEFFFYFHPAQTPHQQVPSEHLTISQPAAQWEIERNAQTGQRCLRLAAHPGTLSIQYQATVEMVHHMREPSAIAEVPLHRLSMDTLQYIYPSRYCQSDRLANFAAQQFGHLPRGYALAQAICTWVQQYVTFRANTSIGTTSAVDTLIERVGVCRDFAHLMIALCRAMNLPTRIVSGTDFGADPALGPPDFHAYVEVYLGDRWYLFDASGTAIPMGMMRLATGRDAADIAFATIFGSVNSSPPIIQVTAEHDEQRAWHLPAPTPSALSTA